MRPLKAITILNDEPACKGVFFRGYSSIFQRGTSQYERREGFKLLKRMSCDGNHNGKCDIGLLDMLPDHVDFGTLNMPPNIKDGAIYTLTVTNIATDWETGYVNDYDLNLVEDEDNDNESD